MSDTGILLTWVLMEFHRLEDLLDLRASSASCYVPAASVLIVHDRILSHFSSKVVAGA